MFIFALHVRRANAVISKLQLFRRNALLQHQIEGEAGNENADDPLSKRLPH